MSNNPLYNLTAQKISFTYQNLLQTDGYGNYYNGLGDEVSVGGGPTGPQGPIGPTGSQGPSGALIRSFEFYIDADESYSSEIIPGIKKDVVIPYNMEIKEWILLSDQNGSISIDIWKSDYDSFPPTILNTITGSEKPTLIDQFKNRNDSLSSWETVISAGDIIRFNVDSANGGISRISLTIKGILI